MADLRLNEARLLQQFASDPNGNLVLRAFFTTQAEYHTGKCVSYMLEYNTQLAQEHAFKANAYAEAMTALETYCKEQLNKASN